MLMNLPSLWPKHSVSLGAGTSEYNMKTPLYSKHLFKVLEWTHKILPEKEPS